MEIPAMTHRFEALAAPLGVDTGDARRLDPAGPWTMPEPAALCTMPPDRRVVGKVTSLTVAPLVGEDAPTLMLYGTVSDDDVVAEIQAGRLFPQLDLDFDATRYEIGDTGQVVELAEGADPPPKRSGWCWLRPAGGFGR
jgi:hypothetical protein